MSGIEVKYVNLPLQYNEIKNEVLKKIDSVFHNGQFILGSEVNDLEKKFAQYSQCKYALGVGNCTDALFLSMKAIGIRSGDEVITVPNSFIATAAAIANTNAKPVFVDVRDDYNINPDLIEEKITEKTKAILPVHLTGRVADMKPIMKIAKKHEIHVIEDAAQSIGAAYYDKKAGSFGSCGCFSLHPLKNLNASGDGGMITTNNNVIYGTLKKLHNHGLKNRDECDFWGYNSRLDTIQAAIVNIKFQYLQKWDEKIKELVCTYQKELDGIVDFPRDKPYEKPVYHLFMISSDKRNKLQQYLSQHHIETKIHYPIPIHLQPAAKYLGYKKGDFPVSEKQAERILSLPIYPELTSDQVCYVSKKIKDFLKTN